MPNNSSQVRISNTIPTGSHLAEEDSQPSTGPDKDVHRDVRSRSLGFPEWTKGN